MVTSRKHYDLYICKFDKVIGYSEIENRLAFLGTDAHVEIRDVSEEIVEERIRIVNSVIAGERCREHTTKSQFDYYVCVIKYHKNAFFGILSAYAEGDRLKTNEFIRRLFAVESVAYFPSFHSTDSCKLYWKHYFDRMPITYKTAEHPQFTLANDEVYEFVPDDVKLFEKNLQNNPTMLKAMFSIALGRVMCICNELGVVVGEDMHDGGKLCKIPIITRDRTIKNDVDELAEYFREASINDYILLENLQELDGYDVDKNIVYSQSFQWDRNYQDFFHQMKMGKVYKLEAFAAYNTPINVTFRMRAESPVIQYRYDPNFFDKISIEGMHSVISQIVNSMFHDKQVSIPYEKILYKESSTKKDTFLDAKVACLAKSGLFDGYSQDELSELAKQCGVVHKYDQQNVVETGERVNALHIVVSGRITMACQVKGGFESSLMMLKQKDVFGIEGLTDDKVSMVDYRVENDDAVLISVPTDVFVKQAIRHPELMTSVLTIQTKRLNKFQKLWAMS